MGDRANVKVTDRDSVVFLYTHWSGTELPEIVRAAMARGKDRWNDGPYLTRIIFCEMVRDGIEDTTGYGISSVCGDGENRIVHVDCDTQRISVTSNRKYVELSFADYVAQKDASWPTG